MIDLKTFQNQLKNLEKDRIHLLFFSYRLNWHNFYKSPLNDDGVYIPATQWDEI